LNTDSESLPMTDAGSEFQREGAARRKERFAKSVRSNGWMKGFLAKSSQKDYKNSFFIRV